MKSKKMPGRVSVYFDLAFLVLPILFFSQVKSDRSNILTADRLQFYFTQNEYNTSIYEGVDGNTFVTLSSKMGIYMTDPTLNVQYRITGGNDDGLFEPENRVVGNFCFLHIRTHTGYEVINRERSDHYRLQIKGIARHRHGSDNQKFTAHTVVNVHVLDVNDLSPIFDENMYNVVIPEDTALHQSIITVGATDADIGVNGDIYYRFDTMTDTFAIHPTTGVVTVTQKLDYNEERFYELDVVAQDRGLSGQGPFGKGRFRKTRLTIEIQQVNAHAPTISVQNLPILESNLVGTVYAILYVTDSDFGQNGEIDSVDIVSGDVNEHFRLVRENNGQNGYKLQVAKQINRQDFPSGFNITIRATDRGTPTKMAYRSIPINLSTGNEADPQFTSNFYEATIDECAPVHTQIMFVSATDSDEGRNGEIVYQLVRGNDLGWFRINERTGMISVAKSLDTETYDRIELVVMAEDQGRTNSRKFSRANVRINITDCNDNTPIFSEANPSVTIEENLVKGTNIYTVTARDNDSGDNGYISYSIANTEYVPFDVEHFSGTVSVTEPLDFEVMQRTYNLIIRASDWGTPFRRESEIVLRVQLSDVNDNTPGFEKSRLPRAFVARSGTWRRYCHHVGHRFRCWKYH